MKSIVNYTFLFIIALNLSVTLRAQQPVKSNKLKENNTLFTAGHASAFIGGLYDGFYHYNQLLRHGDFGLGAPDQLDGELLILGGKIYQTQATGKTFEIPAKGMTPFSVVNFFTANKVVKAVTSMNKDELYAYLDRVLPDQNKIYAIHIRGTFKSLKTRAFPKIVDKPFLPLAQLLPLQQFFTYNDMVGDLVGYRIPNYMEGSNISGYHFHFLSDDKTKGGHIISLLTDQITVEIDELNTFTVRLPQTDAFAKFDFRKDRREEVKQVENGSKL